MEWQQLEHFQAVAALEHMTRAAEKLAITQPALSRSIARLEEELGTRLFERQGRAIKLNRYGRLFQKRTARIFAEMDEAKREIAQLLDPESGEISLGFLHTLGAHRVPLLLANFRELLPRVSFELTQNSAQTLINQVRAGRLDFCFATVTPEDMKAPLCWHALWEEELYVTVPASHRLAKYDTVDLNDVAEESLIFLKKGYGLRTIADTLFEQANILPRIVFEGEEIDTLAGLVSVGLGVSLLPKLGNDQRDGIRQLSVREPVCQRTIGILWNDAYELSVSAKRFRTFVLTGELN